jgi:hypothetical protein
MGLAIFAGTGATGEGLVLKMEAAGLLFSLVAGFTTS